MGTITDFGKGILGTALAATPLIGHDVAAADLPPLGERPPMVRILKEEKPPADVSPDGKRPVLVAMANAPVPAPTPETASPVSTTVRKQETREETLQRAVDRKLISEADRKHLIENPDWEAKANLHIRAALGEIFTAKFGHIGVNNSGEEIAILPKLGSGEEANIAVSNIIKHPRPDIALKILSVMNAGVYLSSTSKPYETAITSTKGFELLETAKTFKGSSEEFVRLHMSEVIKANFDRMLQNNLIPRSRYIGSLEDLAARGLYHTQ